MESYTFVLSKSLCAGSRVLNVQFMWIYGDSVNVECACFC